MKFAYKGFDKSGAPVSDTIDAPDKGEASEVLRRRGVFVSEIAEAVAGAAPVRAASRTGGLGGGKRLEQVADFLRQLSLLVSTGTPLVDAIASLEKQVPEGPWKDALSSVLRRVEEGSQLSEAMAAHPRYFDAVCRSLVSAGETGGRLDAMLVRLSSLTRQQLKIRKTVTGALVYPCLLIVICVVVMVAMLGFVLPRFEGLFQTLDTPLPPTTKVLMSTSAVLREHWYFFLGGMAVAGVAARVWLRTEGGQLGWDRFTVRAPQLGRLTRSFATARIARMLGTLLEGKVALLDALKLTRQSMGNSLYVTLVARAEEAVTRGESISASLGDPTLISPSVCEAIRSGERTGQIAMVLVSVADYLDEDNEVLLKTITGLLEPLILIAMGVMVGGMAISMFLPLFDLTAAGAGPGGGG